MSDDEKQTDALGRRVWDKVRIQSLAHAESMTSFLMHLASAVIGIFLDFVVRGWPLQVAHVAFQAQAVRTGMPSAYNLLAPVLAPFGRLRRSYRLPASVHGTLMRQLLTIVVRDTSCPAAL